MRIDTRLTGVDDVRRVLEQIGPRQATNIMRNTLGGMAGEVRKEARSEAPRDDGDLVKAIAVKRRRTQNGIIRVDVIVRRAAFYWRFVEYGTSKLPENAFFMRALRSFQGRAMTVFLNQFVRKFTQALKRAGRRNGR